MSLTGIIVSASWIGALCSVFVLDVGRGSESDRRSVFLVLVQAVFAVHRCLAFGLTPHSMLGCNALAQVLAQDELRRCSERKIAWASGVPHFTVAVGVRPCIYINPKPENQNPKP